MRILLVEDNSGDIQLLEEYLREAGAGRYQLIHADRLESGLDRLAEADIDAVLLDLSLPDSHGMDTLVRMRAAAKAMPIVVLTVLDDEALGVRLIQAGAQDYLIKGQVTSQLLARSLRYAVERRWAEVALRDSEERFRNLVEGAQDVIMTLSPDGVITSLNPAFERITLWACKEWIGQPVAPLFHDEDLPLAIGLRRQVAEHGEALTCVLRIRSRDRGYVVGEFVGVPHVQNGQLSGLMMIGRDITERKRVADTLERLRHLYGLLLTSVPEGIYGIDLQGSAIFVNPAAARMLGTPSEELLGRHMHTVVHHTKPDGTEYPAEECPIYQALCGGVIQRVADDVFWRADGTNFPVEYTSTPIVEHNGIVGAVVMFRDITERKRVEAELSESEARLRAILDNSPGMVFLKDTEGRYLDANCQFERTFHVSRTDIAGKTDDQIFPTEQAAAFRANDLKVLQTGVPMQFEEVALHDDGPHTSVVYKFPLNNGEGRPYGICGITADITERKAMEEALRQAEGKYRSIFENAVEGIFQSTPDGRYLSVNPALARMYGYASPGELMKSVTDITHELYVDPDRRTEMIRLLEWRGVLQGFEYEVYRKDGSRIWISESARVVRDDGGRALYYEGTVEDITERRRVAEERERLATMIESSNDAIMSLTEGRVSFWNQAAEKLFGYSSAEILGQPVNILVPPHLQGEVERNVERVLRGEQAQHFETERVRKDGRLVQVSITVSPLKDLRGNIIGPFAIIRDITERKRAEEELRRNLGYLELAQTGAEAGLWDWEIGSNTITWSKQYYSLYGLSPAIVPSYQAWLDSVYEEDRARADAAAREAVTHCSDINIDYRIVHPERGLRWLVAIGRTICDDGGKAIRMTGFSFDITERKQAEEELQRTLSQVRMLSRRLEVVREEERARIARELHDELGVRMACLKMDLARMHSLKGEVSSAKLEEKIQSMTEQVDTTIAAVQDLVAELRPGVLDDLGLVAAIEWQCRDFERRSGIRCVVTFKQENILLDSVRATAAFRICQEALTNVLRHAAAKEIRVRLELIDRQLLLDIQDNGRGIASEKVCDVRSLGLLGMRERAEAVGGALRIASSPGAGTTVMLRLPCD